MVAVGVGSSFEEDRRLSPTVTGWSRSGLGLPLKKAEDSVRPWLDGRGRGWVFPSERRREDTRQPRPEPGPVLVTVGLSLVSSLKKAQSDRDQNPVRVRPSLLPDALKEGRQTLTTTGSWSGSGSRSGSDWVFEEDPVRVRPRPDSYWKISYIILLNP